MAAAVECEQLREARAHLPGVLKLLTELSLASIAELVPDSMEADAVLENYLGQVSHVCAQVQLDASKLNPRWNKTYGPQGTRWSGGQPDKRPRGGMPYFCPTGWTRFSLNVVPDDQFEQVFGDWGYLYHGTKGKFVGAILQSGFRASKGLCYCGADEQAVYLSPSIEYCGHPRYGSISYNPETRRWVQIVLQCRVNPKLVHAVKGETLCCKEFGLTVDPSFSNDEMEWLFKPNYTDPQTGCHFIKDAIVCTGIMMRVTADHPLDAKHWWSHNEAFVQRWNLRQTRVDPLLKPFPTWQACLSSGWKTFQKVEMWTYSAETPTGFSGSTAVLPDARMSLAPFGAGHMRHAWILQTPQEVYVVKRYNQETLSFITDGLGISEREAFLKDVRTYLHAQRLAETWNKEFVADLQRNHGPIYDTWLISFVTPLRFILDGQHYFGERYIAGDFVKWNSNTGEVNTDPSATVFNVHHIAEAFSHFTFSWSKGQSMVVDIQGWWVQGRRAVFTDPQIHTRRFHGGTQSRKDDEMYKRFSVGNLGRTGMLRFFMNHKCHPHTCGKLNMANPFHAHRPRPGAGQAALGGA